MALPHLRLQLLFRRRPEWRSAPTAVVEEESPESPLLELSPAALARGLRPGLRLGAARNLDLELRTAVVTDADARELAEELARDLVAFSPRVERCDGRGGPLGLVGAFFLDPRGLDGLFGDPRHWAECVHGYLAGRGLDASVVVGQHAHRCLAIARAHGGVHVLGPDRELELVSAVALRRAGVRERFCEPLARLGVTTVGDLLALRGGELRTRFGPELAELHRLLSDGAQLPLQPQRVAEAPAAHVPVDPPTADAERLAFALKRAIDEVTRQAAESHHQLARMHLELRLEPYGAERKLAPGERRVALTLEPAAATRDGRRWLDLWRLRLASLGLAAPVEALALEGEPVTQAEEQLVVVDAPTRDPRTAREALARVAAAFGAGALLRLRAHDAHLPEASARLERLDPAAATLPQARTEARRAPGPAAIRRLVRPTRLPEGGDGWPRCEAAIRERSGPHRLSGGWWGRSLAESCVERDYWYLHLKDGQIWWVYRDGVRKGWYLQARLG